MLDYLKAAETKFSQWYWTYRSYLKWRLKLRDILGENSNLSGKAGPEAQRFCRAVLRGKGSPRWQAAYTSANGRGEPHYIPEDFFYIYLEPFLNPRPLRPAYDDKNMYDRIFEAGCFPKTLLRCMNGRYYNAGYKPLDESDVDFTDYEGSVIKPSLETGGGKGVQVLGQGEASDITESGDFIVQEKIEQAEMLATFNPGSINSVRILTLLINGEATFLGAYFKMGVGDSFVDNQSQGGIGVAVRRDGSLGSLAVDEAMRRYEHHPSSGMSFNDRAIPALDGLITDCKNLHSMLPYFRLISWDTVFDSEGNRRVFEYNISGQEINAFQVNTGPLLGPHTDQILSEFWQAHDEGWRPRG